LLPDDGGLAERTRIGRVHGCGARGGRRHRLRAGRSGRGHRAKVGAVGG